MMESYFFIPQFFLASFRPSPKLPRHTCGPFASHQCAAAHRLKIAALTERRGRVGDIPGLNLRRDTGYSDLVRVFPQDGTSIEPKSLIF
jgi:hypothetical protein